MLIQVNMERKGIKPRNSTFIAVLYLSHDHCEVFKYVNIMSFELIQLVIYPPIIYTPGEQ